MFFLPVRCLSYVWCEYERDYNDLISASASVSGSGSDSATIASAVIVWVVATIQGLQ
jgi:hypothetical protein